MARPKKQLEGTVVQAEPVEISEPVRGQELVEEDPLKPLAFASLVELGIGFHVLGSKTTLTAKAGNSLMITSVGVVAVSGKNQKKILIPYSNIRGATLI